MTVHKPVCREDGNLELALYGSFLPVPSLTIFDDSPEMVFQVFTQCFFTLLLLFYDEMTYYNLKNYLCLYVNLVMYTLCCNYIPSYAD